MQPEWSGGALPLSPKDRVAWERAEDEIQAHRRGEVILLVVDEHGQPLRDVLVRYEQRRHTFQLGVHYPYHEATYEILQGAGINAATLYLGWEYVQPEPGRFNWDYVERVWRPSELAQRGLRVTGHALNWFKPRWHSLSPYLLETSVADLPRLVYEHVQQIARRWAPYIHVYELVNEPFWEDAHALPLALDDMVRICHATALAVRDIVPAARLMVNFGEISRIPSYHVRPCDLIEALEREGVPFDLIGLQSFENGYTVTTPTTYYRTKTFAGIIQSVRAYANLGKPLTVSALAVPSLSPTGKVPGWFKLPYGAWDQEVQARYLDAFLTLAYAQPEIEGVTWWCPVDGRLALIPGGGLLGEDLATKPAYEALRDWRIRHSTSDQTRTNEQGKAFVCGHAGDYEITVGLAEAGRRITHTIEAGAIHDQTVVLSSAS